MAWSNVYDGKSVESGKCPHCKEMGLLNYGGMEIGDCDDLFYPFTCDNCGCEGREWNVVKFDGMEITKRPIESEVVDG